MARFPIGPFTRGLQTLTDASAGDPQAVVDCDDVRGHTGILTSRTGYKILDLEPSHVDDATGNTKSRTLLTFDGSNDKAVNSSCSIKLGTKWTFRGEIQFAITGVNDTTGTRVLFQLYDGSNYVMDISLIGVTASATIQVRVRIRDTAGNSVTLTSAARTWSEWSTAAGSYSSWFIRVVRDEATAYLYIGETLEDSDTGFTTKAHNTATSVSVGADVTPSTFANINVSGSIVLLNRTTTEADAYWGIHFPTDAGVENDILANWAFIEATGTTVKDYSPYGQNLTITGATWSGDNHAAARGLGIYSWRRANGDLWHAIFCTRRSTDSTGAAPSGAFYTWLAKDSFTPFYFGGDPANDDATATTDEFSPFARMSAVQGRDMLLFSNGVDHARKHKTTTQYLGGTAPALAPNITQTGTGLTGTFIYAYSYFNSVTKTETGLSPPVTDTPANKTEAVRWCVSSDSQFDRVRIYRSRNGETAMYLLTEVAMGTGGPYNDTKADADLVAGPLCPGSDVPGNRDRKRAFLAFPDFRQYKPEDDAQKGPAQAPTVGATAASGNLSAGTYLFAYSYYDSATGLETGMSPPATLVAVANDRADLSALVLPPETSRYDKMRIYRTIATSRTLYLDQTITAATTATSSTSDATLATQGTIETYGLPPKFTAMAVFANRLWGFVNDTLYWSTQGFLEDFPEANGFSPKAGVHIVALSPTEGAMFVHFEDGTIFMLPHPGDQPDLAYFLPLNLRQWSPRGAAVGHFTIQPVPGGLMWLARDGFYFANAGNLQLVSQGISPDFLNLNGARGQYACSLYDPAKKIYRCWLSRGNNRLNEECFVYYLDEGSWWLDNIHADAAGILYDAKENPHLCFLVENGVLCEFDDTIWKDGDGSGTTFGTVANSTSPSATTPGIANFLIEGAISNTTDPASYTDPVGGDGGFAIIFVKSDGTAVQRYAVDTALNVVNPGRMFYPSYSGLTSGVWTAYYNGIRGYIKTMLLHLGDMRLMKNIQAAYFFNRVQSAGGLDVQMSTDEAAFADFNGNVDNTIPVSQVTTHTGSGRVFQFTIASDPPKANQHFGLKGMELEGTIDPADGGTG